MLLEWLTTFRLRAKALFKRRQLDRDLDDELNFHLAMREAKQAGSGMSPDEAHAAARRQFGNRTQLKETARDMWTFVWLESLWQDLRYGVRSLIRNPGFTVVAVITLGLGIGANTAIFSVVNAVLIRPLPYKDPGRLVWVSEYLAAMKSEAVTDPDYEEWRNQNKVFAQLAAYGGGADYNLTGHGRPQRVTGFGVSENFLPLLGVRLALGRNFLPEEDRPGARFNTPRVPVVIITHQLWDRLGGSAKILGSQLLLDGKAYTVVGILPASFQFPGESKLDLLRPAGFPPKPVWDMGKPMLLVRVIGRLKPGVTIQQAVSDVTVMNRWIRSQLPPPLARMTAGMRAEVIPLHRQLVGDARTFLLILFGAAGFVLLIACVNVANLQMERTTTRRKEIALRMAIGAGRGRVVRRLLAESLFVAFLGGTLALAFGFGGIQILRALAPPEIPRPSTITLDPWVLGFTLALACLAAILFGLAPALRAAGTDLNQTLKDTGQRDTPSHLRLRNLLAVSEIGLALILVIGSGLLVRSFMRLTAVDPGFSPRHLLTAQTWLPLPRYADPARQTAFLQEVLRRVRTLPGVEDAAGGTGMPFSGFLMEAIFTIEGQPTPPGAFRAAPIILASPDYFRTLKVPLISGRFFNSHDAAGSPHVIIVNQAFVNRYFHSQSAIGKRVRQGRPDGDWSTIVGVVGNVRHRGLDDPGEPVMYCSYLQNPAPFLSLIVRTTSAPLSLAGALRAQVQSADKDLPVFDVQTMEEKIGATLGSRRFNMFLLTAFALLALVLAAVGLYGVISYSIAQRTHEIGIRMALGAQRRRVLGMILRQAMVLAVCGVAGGLAGAWGLTRLLASMLYGVKATDMATFVIVPLLLIAVALFAAFLPARRATKVDPLVALRHE